MHNDLKSIRTRGFNALTKELGPSGAAIFMRQFDHGEGDYTAERETLNKGTTIEDIVQRINHRKLDKAQRNRPTKRKGMASMSKAYAFLIECGTFFVATINAGAPAVRPFGAVMEFEGALYISTAKYKSVYPEMYNSPIQMVALKPGTRDWARITGKAVETQDLHIKQAMLEACPQLAKRFTKDSEQYALFKIEDMTALLNTNGEFIDFN